MKTPRYHGLPNVDSMRVIPHPEDARVAPTAEHKRGVTENMQKEFDKARGVISFAPHQGRVLDLTEGYQKLVQLMLYQDWPADEDLGSDDPAPGEFVLKNGMSFCRWTGTPAGYRIYQAPGRDMTVVAQVSTTNELVMELMVRGAL